MDSHLSVIEIQQSVGRGATGGDDLQVGFYVRLDSPSSDDTGAVDVLMVGPLPTAAAAISLAQQCAVDEAMLERLFAVDSANHMLH